MRAKMSARKVGWDVGPGGLEDLQFDTKVSRFSMGMDGGEHGRFSIASLFLYQFARFILSSCSKIE